MAQLVRYSWHDLLGGLDPQALNRQLVAVLPDLQKIEATACNVAVTTGLPTDATNPLIIGYTRKETIPAGATFKMHTLASISIQNVYKVNEHELDFSIALDDHLLASKDKAEHVADVIEHIFKALVLHLRSNAQHADRLDRNVFTFHWPIPKGKTAFAHQLVHARDSPWKVQCQQHTPTVGHPICAQTVDHLPCGLLSPTTTRVYCPARAAWQ